MARKISVLGVPTSAGAFAPGQELAPAALRDAGLLERLRAGGAEVEDRGDREPWRWRPDREERRAQNLGKVVEITRDTARRVEEAAAASEVTLVLGGDCTIGIGTVAGQLAAAASANGDGSGSRVGLVYFDTHADLNVPVAVREGALDWMGMAHMLGEPGTRPELAGAFGRPPLLGDEQVVLLGWGAEQATDYEREAIRRRRLATIPVEDVATDPAASAARALELLEPRCDRVLVHFDVDVIDFTDAPISENGGRNEGLPFSTVLRALTVLLSSPRLAALTITELNPQHAEEDSEAIERLAEAVAAGLAG